MRDQIVPVQVSYYCEQLGCWLRPRSISSRRELLGAIDTYDRLGLIYRLLRDGVELELVEVQA